MRSAISTTVIVAIVIVVIAVAGIGAYLALGSSNGNQSTSQTTTSSSSSQTTTSSSSSQSTGPAPPSLNASVNSFLAAFNARNVDPGIKGFYLSDSVVNWTGDTGGTGGVYTGPDNIVLVYATTIGHTTAFSAKIGNLTETSTGSNTATVKYGLFITGSSTIVGPFNASISVTENWVNNGGNWSIHTDVWHYNYFSSSQTSQATVFPQWGLSLKGKPPSLAGEHVFEWNIAPYLALAVYASIAMLGVALLLVRKRGQKK